MTAYRFIQKYHHIFGVRWLLRRLNICPNAYYNYLKDRKSEYHATKRKILAEIRKIYHDHGGVDGYRSMRVFLERKNIRLSAPTVHKYMNKELGLLTIVRRKKANHQIGRPHEVFPNLLQQNFTADEINQKWCTDFTYLYLTDGSMRYNCSILDLHDRYIWYNHVKPHSYNDYWTPFEARYGIRNY